MPDEYVWGAESLRRYIHRARLALSYPLNDWEVDQRRGEDGG